MPHGHEHFFEIARDLRTLAHLVSVQHGHRVVGLPRELTDIADNFIRTGELTMGQVAKVINAAIQVDTNDQAQISSLQSQLATAQANGLDADDLAAIQAAENNPAIAAILSGSGSTTTSTTASTGTTTQTPAPSTSTGTSTGTDTTTAPATTPTPTADTSGVTQQAT